MSERSMRLNEISLLPKKKKSVACKHRQGAAEKIMKKKYSFEIVAEKSESRITLQIFLIRYSSLLLLPQDNSLPSLGVVSINDVVHMNRLWNYNQSITLNHRKSDLLLQCIEPMKLLN